jgi:hypothetical protein
MSIEILEDDIVLLNKSKHSNYNWVDDFYYHIYIFKLDGKIRATILFTSSLELTTIDNELYKAMIQKINAENITIDFDNKIPLFYNGMSINIFYVSST